MGVFELPTRRQPTSSISGSRFEWNGRGYRRLGAGPEDARVTKVRERSLQVQACTRYRHQPGLALLVVLIA